MFYKNTLKTLSTKEIEFEYSLFDELPSTTTDENREVTSGKETYNFRTGDGDLKTGYGFEDIKMPTSLTDLDNETAITLRGTEVKAIWKMKWYNYSDDVNTYYLFYYNNEGYICYDNLFKIRYYPFIIPNDFTEPPYGIYYRVNGRDMLLLSGQGENLLVVSGSGNESFEEVPIIKSCCSHYGKLFAITAEENSQLIYNEDVDITNWTDEKTANLDFSDERGVLNRIISFNDYIYVFRDYGITQLSIYGSNDTFSINHMYLSDSYIYPDSIAQSGDNVYFLERSGLKCFNGSSVKNVELGCENILKTINQSNCFATCFEGKYYLACRCDFADDKQVGCESYSSGYVNNALLIYDIEKKHLDIVRGVDINQVLALNNPHKSKLVACFNNEHIGKIGQLTEDGKIFGTSLPALWQSVKTDLGYHSKKKRIKYFTIKTSGSAEIVISSELESKKFTVTASSKIQKIRTNISGNEFDVKLISSGETNISNFVICASVKK